MVIVKISAHKRGPATPFFWSFSFRTEETKLKFTKDKSDRITVIQRTRKEFELEEFKHAINRVFFECDYIKLIGYV